MTGKPIILSIVGQPSAEGRPLLNRDLQIVDQDGRRLTAVTKITIEATAVDAFVKLTLEMFLEGRVDFKGLNATLVPDENTLVEMAKARGFDLVPSDANLNLEGELGLEHSIDREYLTGDTLDLP
jgi:hypothetical protein